MRYLDRRVINLQCNKRKCELKIKSDEQEWNFSWVDQLVWLAEQLFFREHGTNENLTHTGLITSIKKIV